MSIFEQIHLESSERRQAQEQRYLSRRAERTEANLELIAQAPKRFKPVSPIDWSAWREWLLANEAQLSHLQMARHIEKVTGQYCDWRSITGVLLGFKKRAWKRLDAVTEAVATDAENWRVIEKGADAS